MALPGWTGHRRRSFVDARHDGRRMEVAWHPDAGVVVLSLWQGQTCRSTFRMPVRDAPELIGVLSGALGDALAPLARADDRVPPRRATAASRLIAAVGRAFGRERADVVPLRSVRRADGVPHD